MATTVPKAESLRTCTENDLNAIQRIWTETIPVPSQDRTGFSLSQMGPEAGTGVGEVPGVGAGAGVGVGVGTGVGVGVAVGPPQPCDVT